MSAPLSPVTHPDTLGLKVRAQRDRCEARLGCLTAPLGARLPGERLVIVRPDQPAMPFHRCPRPGDGDVARRSPAIRPMNEPDVIGYPDSGKSGVMVGAAPGGDKASQSVAHVRRYRHAAGYWDDAR